MLQEISIDLSESGETVVSNLDSTPATILTVSAGYLGSALCGSLLLRRGLKASLERLSLLCTSFLLACISRLFCGVGELSFYVGIGSSFFFLISVLAGRTASRCSLLFTGTLLVWYSLFDLLDFTRANGWTDVDILADYLQRKGWMILAGFSNESLIVSISILWSSLVIGIILVVLYPVFVSSISSSGSSRVALVREDTVPTLVSQESE